MQASGCAESGSSNVAVPKEVGCIHITAVQLWQCLEISQADWGVRQALQRRLTQITKFLTSTLPYSLMVVDDFPRGRRNTCEPDIKLSEGSPRA